MRVIGKIEGRIIDSARGMAILMVMFTHIPGQIFNLQSKMNLRGSNSFFSFLATPGATGVELFFVISGYLMVRLYGIYGSSSEFKVRDYLIKRFFRIYPLWIIFIFIVLGYQYLSSKYNLINLYPVTGVTGLKILLVGSFIITYVPSMANSFIPGGWSIEVEVLSYWVYLVSRIRSFINLRKLFILINIIYLIIPLHLEERIDNKFVSYITTLLRYMPLPTYGLFFIIGGLLAGLVSRDFKYKDLERYRLDIILLLLAAGANSTTFSGDLFSTLGSVIVGVGIVLMVYQGKFGGFLRLLGRYSYFIYFVHFFVLNLISTLLAKSGVHERLFTNTDMLFLIYLLILLPFAISLGYLANRFIEAPIARFSRRFLSRE